MNQQFTSTPLYEVSGVKYDIKNKNALVILPLVFVCDFTSEPDFSKYI
jgi:hypothetical protein